MLFFCKGVLETVKKLGWSPDVIHCHGWMTSLVPLYLKTTYKKEPVFFFDEIQNVNQWEKFVNRMYEKGLKLFVTGSNANLLSSEIASSLTGRNKLIELYPFSFSEYLRKIKKTYDLQKLSTKSKNLLKSDFNDYIQLGGFPLVIKEHDLELINSYFQDILYRDIISRYKLIQVNEIKQIGLYFASNVGKLFSYSTLQQITGLKSTASVKNYLEYFDEEELLDIQKQLEFKKENISKITNNYLDEIYQKTKN
jgi:predicted AAA+ superfamily ATPase